MYADRFLYNNTNNAHYNAAMQLVKLHGSVNWIKDKDGAIEEHRNHLSFDDVRSTSGSKDIQEDILIYQYQDIVVQVHLAKTSPN
jgi:hypothetical protein